MGDPHVSSQAMPTGPCGERRRGRPVLPRLIVIRGNSASGKSAAAAAIRDRHGRRDLAIVGQDNLRRVILREHDVPGGANIDLIDLTARFALSRGFHTIVEGIFTASHYGAMLTALIGDHAGRCLRVLPRRPVRRDPPPARHQGRDAQLRRSRDAPVVPRT